MRAICFFISTSLVLGCASSAPEPAATPESGPDVRWSPPERGCTENGCPFTTRDPNQVMRMKNGDGAVTSDDTANEPRVTYECATEWGPREPGSIGEADVTLTGREDVDTHVATVFSEGGVRTMCRTRTKCDTDTDVDQCTDYDRCCTLGEHTARPPEQMQQ